MKHDGFQCGICERSFAHRALNHSTKSSHVCRKPKQLAPLCDENQTPSMWISGTSHHWCQIWHPHINKPIVTKLEHGVKLCRCLDPYGERDLNPIHFTYILEIKDIIKLNTNPWLNIKCWVFVHVPNALLVFLVQVGNILESYEIIPCHLLTWICLCPPNFFMLVINLFHNVP
jgi:hypothetical protein